MDLSASTGLKEKPGRAGRFADLIAHDPPNTASVSLTSASTASVWREETKGIISSDGNLFLARGFIESYTPEARQARFWVTRSRRLVPFRVPPGRSSGVNPESWTLAASGIWWRNAG